MHAAQHLLHAAATAFGMLCCYLACCVAFNTFPEMHALVKRCMHASFAFVT